MGRITPTPSRHGYKQHLLRGTEPNANKLWSSIIKSHSNTSCCFHPYAAHLLIWISWLKYSNRSFPFFRGKSGRKMINEVELKSGVESQMGIIRKEHTNPNNTIRKRTRETRNVINLVPGYGYTSVVVKMKTISFQFSTISTWKTAENGKWWWENLIFQNKYNFFVVVGSNYLCLGNFSSENGGKWTKNEEKY